MIAKQGNSFDIILITGEYYDDHPLSPAGVIARVLDARGYNIGIIERPQSKEDFTSLGSPKLFWGITSGSIDSMLHNYTPLKRKREEDEHATLHSLPDRAVIYYCNKIREYSKSATLVIGGVESSLRRFAHYDYWSNSVRRSILLDSRADILVYGNGEKQVLQIANRLADDRDLAEIEGTCIVAKELASSFELLPAFEEVKQDSKAFCHMQNSFTSNTNLAQKYDNRYVLQYRYPEYTSEDLDWVYSLPFSRELNPESLLKMAQFSVVTHRGCFGDCNFCSLGLHQGSRIISRSEGSILAEIKSLTRHPEFKGYIDDLGGPSANMYSLDCVQNLKCKAKSEKNRNCFSCKQINRDHARLISLLRKARQIEGVKKIFVRSGVRYDLALESKQYIQELSAHHVSGLLKIAPEHVDPHVLALMNKQGDNLDEFVSFFDKVNKGRKQYLRYYFMLGHPGEDEQTIANLARKMRKLGNAEQFQLFTPLPMTVSACMYWTGLDPRTMKPVKVIREYGKKKELKRRVLQKIES